MQEMRECVTAVFAVSVKLKLLFLRRCVNLSVSDQLRNCLPAQLKFATPPLTNCRKVIRR